MKKVQAGVMVVRIHKNDQITIAINTFIGIYWKQMAIVKVNSMYDFSPE